jgi:small subunit ribosomal protein S1
MNSVTLKVGDTVEVLIDIREQNWTTFYLTEKHVLSNHGIELFRLTEGEIVNGFVKCRTKGGMIVDVFGIEAFLPGSQMMLNQLEIMMFT